VGEVVGEFDYLGWRLDGGSFVMDLAPEKGTTTSNCGKPSLGSRMHHDGRYVVGSSESVRPPECPSNRAPHVSLRFSTGPQWLWLVLNGR
jgi:hypothetical protein